MPACSRLASLRSQRQKSVLRGRTALVSLRGGMTKQLLRFARNDIFTFVFAGFIIRPILKN